MSIAFVLESSPLFTPLDMQGLRTVNMHKSSGLSVYLLGMSDADLSNGVEVGVKNIPQLLITTLP